jgi:hypothetical protein
MTKEAKKIFPAWTIHHQTAFKSIKSLVLSTECLTTVDHKNPGDSKIFITCNASNWCTNAVLSFGPTWESAHPVTFDSMKLKGPEKNYPVHEKRIIGNHTCSKKWRADLLGSHIYVYTNHRTLENFNTQKDLSCWQLKWQEFLSQYNMTITYI